MAMVAHFSRSWNPKGLRLLRAGLFAIYVLLSIIGNSAMADTVIGQKQPVRITLVGASIGEGWKLPSFGSRMALTGYAFSYIGVYDFDKSALIDQLVASKDKPTAVMIKECSTYFPGDQARQRSSVMAWVKQLRAAGIEPILVTTAPVAQPTDLVGRTIKFVKRLAGQPSALESLTAFNDWLKQYAGQQGLRVFDLEAVLHRSDSDRWMKAEYDSGDHVHLNGTAYGAMDKAFAEFLAESPMHGGKQ